MEHLETTNYKYFTHRKSSILLIFLQQNHMVDTKLKPHKVNILIHTNPTTASSLPTI